MARKLTNRRAVPRYVLTLILSCSFFVWGLFENSGRESKGVAVLFALPLLMEVGALLYLRLKPVQAESAEFFNLFWRTILFCAVLNYAFWIIYLVIVHSEVQGLDAGNYQFLSYLSLGGIALLLVFVSIVTLAFMTPKEGGGRLVRYLENLKSGAERRPFWTLLHSMSVFLTVAYLFGFAFAFHDLTVAPPKPVPEQGKTAAGSPTPGASPSPKQLPPLYMANLPNFDHEQPPPNEQEAGELPCVDFYFAQPSADLERFDEGDNTDPQKILEGGLMFTDQEKAERKKKNQEAMHRAVERIINLTADGQQAHVQLLGHASKTPVRRGPSNPYDNNYVLSQARVLGVLSELKSEVSAKNGGQWVNVEWDPVALSSAEFPQARSYMDKVCRAMIDDEKVVHVSISAVRGHPFYYEGARYKSDDYKRLSLLDDLYFAMYTVTTTGYGDIVPTTNYAKFLTCLANICEVFFIVGLFNSLMALKGSDGEGRRGGLHAVEAERPT